MGTFTSWLNTIYKSKAPTSTFQLCPQLSMVRSAVRCVPKEHEYQHVSVSLFACAVINTLLYLLFLGTGLVGFLGILGPPLILRRQRFTESLTPATELCSDMVRRDHGFTSNMSNAATTRALPTCLIQNYSQTYTLQEVT